MYNEFYNLQEPPFSLTNDPRFFYSNNLFDEAIKYMNYLVDNRQGFLEITGPVGCGKTLLCRTWIKQLPPNIKSLFFSHPDLSELDFLQEVCLKLNLENKGNTYSEFIRALNEYLLEAYSKNENVVFIFDDAHDISLDLLEAIRLCSNVETEKAKLLQIILVGEPSLDAKLKQRYLRQLDQRIALRFQLAPLKKSEIKDYIDHRLQVAEIKGDIMFTRGAVNMIYNFSHGLPRLINTVCDKALLMGYFFKSRKITSKLVEAGIKNTQGRWQHFPSLFFLSLSRAAVWVIILLLGATIVTTWHFQENLLTWTRKITPTLSVIKVSLLHRLNLPPVDSKPKKNETPAPPVSKQQTEPLKTSKK